MIGKFLQKLVTGEIAEWIHLVREDLYKLENEGGQHTDESVTTASLEFERAELLDGAVIAKHPFGFGMQVTEMQDGRDYTAVNRAADRL